MTPEELLDEAYEHCCEALEALARLGPKAARDGIIVLADLGSQIGRQVAAFAVANNSSGKLTPAAAEELLADMPGPVAVVASSTFVAALASYDTSGDLARFVAAPPTQGLVRVLAITDKGLGPATLEVPSAAGTRRTTPPPATAGVRFARTEKDPSGGVHHVYEATSEAAALDFLDARDVGERMLFLHVDTPQGNWGRDVAGLFLESLRAWQDDVEGLSCHADIVGVPSRSQLEAAANGVSDNFVAELKCSKCGHLWLDGVSYQRSTAVRCRSCRALLVVDSSNVLVA